jgi:DRG Family Regulatory Proteins, Tma46/Zinc finger C-x8-C-x5-C-x3-H type (and similar)
MESSTAKGVLAPHEAYFPTKFQCKFIASCEGHTEIFQNTHHLKLSVSKSVTFVWSMPPKKNQGETKAKASKRSQAASDKTFGLKNKNKSSKVQAYVQQVEAQAQNTSQAAKRKEAEAVKRAAEKKAAEIAKAEARELFKPVSQIQKVPFGVDPKTVLCFFFKQGTCSKGNKCKFSHNLDVERKTHKKDLYSDEREDKEKDTMENWDEEKLRSVVSSKHGNPKTTTDIICKFFIEAVENQKYGWFWVCPNGGDACKYRHSLPPGFKLKTKEELRLERQAEADKPTITLEDFIETERQKLPKTLTPVTLDSFAEWKKKRLDKKQAELELELKKQKTTKNMSGKQLLDSGKFVLDVEEEEEGEGEAWNLDELRRRVESDDEEQPDNDLDGNLDELDGPVDENS